jgi:hypothetical protein
VGIYYPPHCHLYVFLSRRTATTWTVGKDIECGAELTVPEERSPYEKLCDARVAELAAKFKVVEAASQDL